MCDGLVVTPPPAVVGELDLLGASVGQVVPPKGDRNLLIGTWNLRAFGEVTPTWAATEQDTPKRDWRAVACIAYVVRRFDVVAVQEVRRNTKALPGPARAARPDLRLIISDVTEGDPGNGERLCSSTTASGCGRRGWSARSCCPPEADGPTQFARTPYAVSVHRPDVEFILTTVHVLWGTAATGCRSSPRSPRG